jgi:hypothetical protein
MGKISEVEISGHRYRYQYDEALQRTLYLGPVGEAPAINEEEFLMAIAPEQGGLALDGYTFHRSDVPNLKVVQGIGEAYWHPNMRQAQEIWPGQEKKNELRSRYSIAPTPESLWDGWQTNAWDFLTGEMGYASSTADNLCIKDWRELGPRQKKKIAAAMEDKGLIIPEMPVVNAVKYPHKGYTTVLRVGDRSYFLQEKGAKQQFSPWPDPAVRAKREFYQSWFGRSQYLASTRS